jgi:hypothetical protein
MDERDGLSVGLSQVVGALTLAWTGFAYAQSAAPPPPPPAAQHYLYTTPYAGGTTDPFDLNVAPVQNGPAGTVAVTSSAPPSDYSFAEFARNIHGYVSTGVSTQGGHDFSGGVTMPLVPGKADLTVSASSGQIGGFQSLVPGQKTATAHYDTYSATLHLHPADDLDAYIGITGGNYKLPYALTYPRPYPGFFPGQSPTP